MPEAPGNAEKCEVEELYHQFDGLQLSSTLVGAMK